MTIKEIIQKLNTTIADHRGHESHFESWLTLIDVICEAIDALKALDKQEPVAWTRKLFSPELGEFFDYKDGAFARETDSEGWTPLYTTPPQRKPMTDEEIEDLYFDKFSMGELKAFARAIEAKLKEKTHDTRSIEAGT